MEETIIKLSKTKIIFVLCGAILFVLAGIWLWSMADKQKHYDPNYVKGAAILSIGFFGICGIYGIFKLFDNKPGLIVNEYGILDNSSGVSGHLIKWGDIENIAIGQVRSTKFLLIFIYNPQDYIKRANRFKRILLRMGLNYYGTPLSISSTTLKCDFKKLEETIKNGLDYYRNKNQGLTSASTLT